MLLLTCSKNDITTHFKGSICVIFKVPYLKKTNFGPGTKLDV